VKSARAAQDARVLVESETSRDEVKRIGMNRLRWQLHAPGRRVCAVSRSVSLSRYRHRPLKTCLRQQDETGCSARSFFVLFSFVNVPVPVRAPD
jgi:hypothetical protein